MRHRPSDSLPTLYKPLPVTQSSAWVIHGAPELVVGCGNWHLPSERYFIRSSVTHSMHCQVQCTLCCPRKQYLCYLKKQYLCCPQKQYLCYLKKQYLCYPGADPGKMKGGGQQRGAKPRTRVAEPPRGWVWEGEHPPPASPEAKFFAFLQFAHTFTFELSY